MPWSKAQVEAKRQLARMGFFTGVRRRFPAPPNSASSPWPSPKSLSASLPTVESFNPGLLPAVLRRRVEDIAARLQVPLDFPAAIMVVALGAMLGLRAVIQPKTQDDWRVTPNLWGAIVGPPSSMKTPSIRAVLKPLEAMQRTAMEKHRRELEVYENELEKYNIRKDDWKRKSRAAATKGSQIEDFALSPPAKPALPRYILNDATIEKLHEILEDNPQGVFLLRDELAGWFATLDKKGRESERPFYLESWNGDGSYAMDRIGRDMVYVPHLCVSVFGGVQPAKLKSYLRDAVLGGFNDDGLAQRLQVLVWPDSPTDWENIDRPPDSVAESEIIDLFERIDKMPPDDPTCHRFDSEAQQLFDDWRQELELRLRREDMPAVLESHLAKYRSLMPSLALIFHICENPDSPVVSLIQAQRAAAFCAYLESHARRVYSCVVRGENRAAATLGEKLKGGQLGAEFTVREVYLKKWAGLGGPERAREALEILEEAGWVRRVEAESSTKGGRPPERYEVNPEVLHGS